MVLRVRSSGAQALGLGHRADLSLPLARHLHGHLSGASATTGGRRFSQDPSRLRGHGGGEQQHGADEEPQAGGASHRLLRGGGRLIRDNGEPQRQCMPYLSFAQRCARRCNDTGFWS
ncbi:hypothetical protein D1007_03483 [Hordeum vulgare]|nr:hypothetical protein D1007_03483 [Hordeum vulgare]